MAYSLVVLSWKAGSVLASGVLVERLAFKELCTPNNNGLVEQDWASKLLRWPCVTDTQRAKVCLVDVASGKLKMI